MGVEEARNGRPGALVGGRGHFAQVMNAAVNIGVLLRVVADDAVDDGLRLLGRRRVVEIDQPLATHIPLQNREVGADAVDIKPRSAANRIDRSLDRSVGAHCVASRRPGCRSGIAVERARRICSRTGAIFIRSTISLANA